MNVLHEDEKRAVLQLIAAALNQDLHLTEDLKCLIKQSWAAISEELKMQTVDLIPFDRIIQLDLAPEQQALYLEQYAHQLKSFHSLMMEQAAVLSLLEESGIDAVVLKGAAAAVYYPVPEHRRMGDIDLIVEPKCFDKAYEVLRSHGYQSEESSGSDERHIHFMGESGIQVELHKSFSASNHKDLDAILNQYIYDAIPKREITEIEGYPVSMLPVFENGLVLLSHINQHLGTGLGLRQILDWRMYVEHHLGDEQWERQMKAASEKAGLRKLAEVVTMLCKRELGLSQSITWCDRADPELVDELREYLFEQGNFGRHRESNSQKTMTVMRQFFRPSNIFSYLTRGGMSHWKAAQRYPFLKYFAWIYQIGYLLRSGIKRGVHMQTFLDELEESRERDAFLKKLEVTRR